MYRIDIFFRRNQTPPPDNEINRGNKQFLALMNRNPLDNTQTSKSLVIIFWWIWFVWKIYRSSIIWNSEEQVLRLVTVETQTYPLILIGRDCGEWSLWKYERSVCQHVLLGFDRSPVGVDVVAAVSGKVADMKTRLIPMHWVENDLFEWSMEQKRNEGQPGRVRTK